MDIISASNIVCPLDGLLLTQNENGQLTCANKHCFDIAKQGYFNLLPVQNKRSKHPGDSKEMVQARSRFLDTGVYNRISEATNNTLLNLLSTKIGHLCVLDAGCGEGYYLASFTQFLLTGEGNHSEISVSLVGMDISKPAILAATKRNRSDIQWIVGSNKKPPILAESLDAVLCMFGFPVYDEFSDLLKADGNIILVEAGPNHLIELRQALYEEVNTPKVPSLDRAFAQGFELVSESALQHKTPALQQDDIQDLLLMTPHYFKASTESKSKLAQIESMTFTIDVVIRVLQKSTAKISKP